jgi:uncharacterized protein (DUF58 family)
VPARRLFFAVGLATLFLGVAPVAPWVARVVLSFDVVFLLAFLGDPRRALGSSLSARRDWPPVLVQGAPARVEVRFSSARQLHLWAREALHPGLAAGPLRSEVRTVPDVPSVWTYELSPRRRGEHLVGPLTARILGPWGLAWSQVDLLPPEPRRVYPQVRWEGRAGRLLALARRRELGQAPLRLQGLGTEPYALREYRPGDPPTRIHWKATARHGKPISREDTWERGARLVILLDCARAMMSLDAQRSKLDHALAAGLALARVGVSRSDRVTIVAFSDRILRIVRVRPGERGISLTYAALYDVEAELSEPAYDLAVEQALALEPRRATVLLLTSIVDLAATELLREGLLRLRRRHRPILVNLEDRELSSLALGAPSSPEEAFAKVSGLEILLANRRLARRLRHAGIDVVVTVAAELVWDTLEAYLVSSGPRQRSRRAL